MRLPSLTQIVLVREAVSDACDGPIDAPLVTEFDPEASVRPCHAAWK